MIKKAGLQLKGVPDIPVLHSLLAKAVQKPGDVQSVSWRNSDAQLLVLEVVCPHKERVPHWQVFLDRLGRRAMLGECYGHDTLMVFKHVSAAAATSSAADAKPEEGSRAARAREARAKTLNSLPIGTTVDPSKPKDFDAKSVYLQRVTEITESAGGPTAASAPGGFWTESGVVINDFFTEGQPVVQMTDNWASNSSGSIAALVDSNEDAAAALAAAEAAAAAAAKAAAAAAEKRQAQQAQAQGPAHQAPSAPQTPKAPPTLPTQPMDTKTPRPEPKPIEINNLSQTGRMDTRQVGPEARNPLRIETNQAKPEGVKSEGSKSNGAKSDSAKSDSAKLAAAKPEPPPAKAEPPAEPEAPKKKYPSRGNLEEFSIKKLLRILKEEHFAGRVRFEDDDQTAVVFFVDGFPLECAHGDLRGDAALMELLLWGSGTFKVTPNIEPRARNVNTTVEILSEQNRHLAKLLEELAGFGMNASSTFLPSNPKLSREEFYAIAAEDAPFNLDTLGHLYLQLDGLKTLSDLAKLQLLPKPLLIRGLHHLAICELITLTQLPKGTRKPTIQPKNIDGAAIQSVMMSLRREDTGLFIYPAFLYFLEEEFFRIYRARGTMSLLIFEIRELVETPEGFKRKPISTEAVADAVMRIFKRKRHTDILGHYEAFDFAAILPGTKPGGASVFAQKIYKGLAERPLVGMEGKRLSMVFGAAGIPEDCTDVNNLLAAAEFALNHARAHGKPFATYSELLV